MKENKNKISKKYTKIMLVALLIIASILSVYVLTNTNDKVFNVNIINQKADTREVVNIPDQDLKNFLLTYFKKNEEERRRKDFDNWFDTIRTNLLLTDNKYIKPSDENEIYKDEMEKIIKIYGNEINKKTTPLDLTGLEKAINLTQLYLNNNKIENVEPLKGLTNLTYLDLEKNKIENIEPLKELTNLRDLYLNNNKIENVEPLRGLTNLVELTLYNNKIDNIDSIRNLNNLKILVMFNEEINIAANTNKFNLPVLKKYNGDIIDVVKESNGLLKKNVDGTYSFTRDVNEIQTINIEKPILINRWDNNGLLGSFINLMNPAAENRSRGLYILKIDPTKIAVTKDITVNGGDKSRLPNEITATISNNKGLPEKEVKATLKPDKSGYVVNENLDKTTNTGENITYTVTPKTDITNYAKNDSGYTYVSPKTSVNILVPKENGKPIPVKVILTRNGSKVLPEKAVTVNTGETARFTDLDKTDS
ncbi:MAG: leucine-rich repeat domain-containing protein, partial [Clostridiales bacterium]|nr:leucine-rich repeat domain-containing protein [Clostridiales bacterium]